MLCRQRSYAEWLTEYSVLFPLYENVANIYVAVSLENAPEIAKLFGCRRAYSHVILYHVETSNLISTALLLADCEYVFQRGVKSCSRDWG